MTEPRDGSVVFERHQFPIVVLRMPPNGNVASIHLWYDEVESMLRKATTKIALVHDLRPVEILSITALHRAAVAERTLALRDSGLGTRIGADARIVGNAIVAGAASVVTWLTGATPWPQATFASEREAVEWCRAQLDAR